MKTRSKIITFQRPKAYVSEYITIVNVSKKIINKKL